MVKKSHKAKTANLKQSTGVKKSAAKKEKITNGYKDNKKTESTSDEVKTDEIEAHELGEDIVAELEPQEDAITEENLTDTARQEEHKDSVFNLDESETVRKSRKRRANVDVKDEIFSNKTIKTKRQKVLKEIPKLSSITGKVFVIGDNMCGQLGLGEDVQEKKRPALVDLPYGIIDIAAGGMHSVCLTESGEVLTFGCNDEGVLGRITSEEGSEYVPHKVNIPERIVQVSAGDNHSAALSESGQVYIWGNFRRTDGYIGLIAAGTKEGAPVKILNDVTVVKISSGCEHLACLSQEGMVYTCGVAENGQLGRIPMYSSNDGGRQGINALLTPDKVVINSNSAVDNVWTGSYTTFVNVKKNGLVYAFGLNNYNQLGLQNRDEDALPIFKPKRLKSFERKKWSQINGGQHHTLALDDSGLVYSLGRSDYGRLGLGENCDVKSEPTEIPSLHDKTCIDISCGNCASFTVTDTGSVFSWGFGTNYQLGHGDDNDQHTPHLIEGNFFNSWKAIKIAGGGQHTLVLAQPRKSAEKSQ